MKGTEVREKMVKWREEKGLSMEQAAKLCNISRTLLGMVEEGEVTHPLIARKIGNVYGLTSLEREELMPTIHRKHHPDYVPDN